MDKEDIIQLIRQEMQAAAKDAQYNVALIPYHVHNGLDSSQLQFIKLSDVPVSYSGQAGKAAVVNSIETALEFDTVTTAPGGSTTQVQFNDGGVFAGNAHLTFDKSTNTFNMSSGSLATFNGKLKLPVGTNLYP